MQETREFSEKIKENRLNNARNERLEFLWNDFLEAVEKVINLLSDEELSATYWITIRYETKEDGKVYRCRFAETDWSELRSIEYEPRDKNLGLMKLLHRPFNDFREKAEQDEFVNADYFDIEKLFYGCIPTEIMLDFNIGEIETEPKTKQSNKYKLVSK